MAKLTWAKHIENADSPYPEDRRVWYTCAEFGLEITKERDNNYWLRHTKKPLGMGPRLRDAKAAAERFVDELRSTHS